MADDDYTPEQIAAHDAWVAAEFARGRCPYSGLLRHACHRSVCDCFDADRCPLCQVRKGDSSC